MNDRRSFLKSLSVTAASAGLAHRLAGQEKAATGERLRLAMIGTGGMGMNHVRTLCQRTDIELGWVIDADIGRAQEAAKVIRDSLGQTPRIGQDLRAALDDSTVRACFMATPDHWHAPGAILAAEAGKAVYVEKPCSHNLREGRLMIEAANRHGVSIQVGTQSRSTPHVREVVEKIRQGVIGEVLVAKAWNSQKRADHGRQPASEPPSDLDYEAWLGPVPAIPFKKTYHPAHWRWFHHFGTGDIGNDGVHDIDIARWGLGVETHPSRIQAMGEKLYFADDQEWPDTLYCAFGYVLPDGKKRQLIYEQRIWSPYMQEGEENGCAWYGTEGMIVGSKRSGWRVVGPKNQPIAEITANGVDLAAHHENFLRSVRGTGAGKLHAGIETNHYSSALCHLANIAVRTGRSLAFQPTEERFDNDPEADRLLSRAYRDHWAKPKGV